VKAKLGEDEEYLNLLEHIEHNLGFFQERKASVKAKLGELFLS